MHNLLHVCLSLLSIALLCNPPSAHASDPVNPYGSGTDISGKITTAIFYSQGTPAQEHWNNFPITVPEGYVVIGGGAVGCYTDGNYLVASYPSTDLTTWYVSTKDQIEADACEIVGYAIGMSVEGLTSAQLASYISVTQSNSAVAQYPSVSVSVPANYTLLGGGYNTNYGTGNGVIATAIYPASATSMQFNAKSQGNPEDQVSATVYAIGILTQIPGVGTIKSAPSDTTSVSNEEFPTNVLANLTTGYALTGCGAQDVWSGAGNLLYALYPTYLIGAGSGTCSASAKDDTWPGNATEFTVWAMGIQLVQ